jgi:hypothetical protein
VTETAQLNRGRVAEVDQWLSEKGLIQDYLNFLTALPWCEPTYFYLRSTANIQFCQDFFVITTYTHRRTRMERTAEPPRDLWPMSLSLRP